MKCLLAIILFVANYKIGHSQSMLEKVDSLKPIYRFYEWKNKNRISLTTFGSLERQFPRIIFTRIHFDKQTDVVSIDGFINMTGDRDDTISRLCCFDVLIAKAKKREILSDIRRFGETFSTSKNVNASNQEGEFHLNFKLKRNDVLLIGDPGTLYWGAVIVPLGRSLQ